MSDQILSQDEVDSLLSGVDSDEPVLESVGDEKGVRAYDLANQNRIVRGRMPTLESVHEQFCRLFRTVVTNITSQSTEVTSGPIKFEKFSEFMSTQVIPSNLNIMQVKPLRGKCLLIFEPQLICALVDGLFGGSGTIPSGIEGREFSKTEKRIITRLVDSFTESYRQSWDGVYPIELEYVRSEMLPQFASIASPAESVVSTRFWIESGTAAGAVHLCIPYGTLEPIRETLYSAVNSDQIEKDGSWVRKLSSQLESADIELVADLSKTDITFGELLNLQVGDFIELDLKETLSVTAGNVPFLRCRYGVNENRYAVKIEKFLTVPDELINGVHNG
ncbi:MAG: flagellar motor switch protein FliM [Burkholderiaceae bacterium]